ncbi:hypothetical protein B1H10_01435 [candidate division KSB1 bacterium 4484_188]|nr:MAG: hypothetical protein B1H10_01435 [candidate division KSB1 bacterium 4484_188]
MSRPARFNKKAFVSFAITFIGIIIALTGIVLYFAPPGRVAYWVEWKFLGLTKENWQAVHTIFAFIFVVAAGFHLYYNWVIFLSYLKSKVQAGIKMKRELGWASALTGLILVLTIASVPPFSSVMDLGEYLSDSWSSQETEPPIPHAELMTVKEFAETTKQDLKTILQKLNREGLQGVDSLAVIGDIAKMNNLTPQELSAKISAKSGASPQTMTGPGYGQKTISQICQELGIDSASVIQNLNRAGIKFKKDKNLRQIANNNDIKPIDLVKIIRGENDRKE